MARAPPFACQVQCPADATVARLAAPRLARPGARAPDGTGRVSALPALLQSLWKFVFAVWPLDRLRISSVARRRFLGRERSWVNRLLGLRRRSTLLRVASSVGLAPVAQGQVPEPGPSFSVPDAQGTFSVPGSVNQQSRATHPATSLRLSRHDDSSGFLYSNSGSRVF
jgi:hypothetical protein